MSTPTPSALRPSLSMAASALFWGTTWYPLHRIGDAGVSPSWGAVLIYVIPTVIAAPLILFRLRTVRAGGWPLLFVGLGVGACNALFAAALAWGEVGIIVLLFYLNPIWATVMERIVLGTPIARFRLVGIGVGILGMVALQGLAGRWPIPANLAEWMGLAAGFCWAVTLVASNVARGTTIVDQTSLQFVSAAVIALILVVVLGQQATMPSAGEVRTALPWVLATAGLWIVPAMALSLWAAARLSPARASMLLMLEVIVAIASAAWLNDEAVGLNKLVGGGLILSATLVEAWGSARSNGKAAAAGAAGSV